MYKKELIDGYAQKFLVDHPELENPEIGIPEEKLTEQYLKHLFKDCAIPARKDMLPQIRQAIKRLRNKK